MSIESGTNAIMIIPEVGPCKCDVSGLGGDYWYGTNNGVSLYQPRSRKWTHYLDGTEYSGKVVLALAEDSGETSG